MKILNKFKKEKEYSFTNLGFVEMTYESRIGKQSKVSNIGYYTILVLLLGLGLLSREFIIAIAVNAGISKVANVIIK